MCVVKYSYLNRRYQLILCWIVLNLLVPFIYNTFFSFLYHFYNNKPCFCLFTSEQKQIICWKENNFFQYPFVTMNFSNRGETLVQLVMSERQCKWNIYVKIQLPTTVTQFCMPPIKSDNWFKFVNRDMLINGSHPYLYSDTLYKNMHHVFTFYNT